MNEPNDLVVLVGFFIMLCVAMGILGFVGGLAFRAFMWSSGL